jgi:hypothetical protein
MTIYFCHRKYEQTEFNMNKPPRVPIAAVSLVAALLLGACASESDPTTSDEFVAVSAELDESAATLEQTQSELADAEEDLATEQAAHAKTMDELSAAETEATQAGEERDAALAEAEALRIQYDPEIRAELSAAVDAEVAAACALATTDLEASIPSLVNYDEAWSPVASEADVIAAVEACAAPERNKSAEEREAAKFDSYGYLTVDEVVKNPDAFEGQAVIAFGDIVQWDVNTGTCAFHANFLGELGGRYDYDERGEFTADEVVCVSLEGIDQDDIVKMWVTGTGSRSYSTSIGGTNTIPTFQIDKIELVEKK